MAALSPCQLPLLPARGLWTWRWKANQRNQQTMQSQSQNLFVSLGPILSKTQPTQRSTTMRMPRAQLERPGWHFCILLFKIFRSQVEINFDAAITPPSLQQKLRMAAKARMMRWVKPKSKRKDREAPEWLKKEWAEGSKNNIADLFSHVNFDQESVVLVSVLHPAVPIRAKNTGFTLLSLCVCVQAEFLNRLKVSVLKKQLVELTIDEGWYSESEMRGDLGWPAKGPQV